MIPKFDRLQTDDSVLNRIQDRLKSVINAVVGREIVDGAIVTFDLGVGTTNVPHGLGRMPHGWFIVNPIPGLAYEAQVPDARFLYVSVSSPVVGVRFWVF